MIPIRFYIYAGIAALIAYLLWREHHLTHKLAETRVELSQAHANYAALKEAQAHERRISEDASNDYQRRLTEIANDRATIPVRSVRMRSCTPTSLSATTDATGRTNAGSAEPVPPTTGSDPGDGRIPDWTDDGPDAGPALYALADEADQAVARCAALQLWVRSR